MIGIIGAMEEEVQALLRYLDLKETIEKLNYRFYLGKIDQKDCVIVQGGIGKVNAAMSATLLLEQFPVIDNSCVPLLVFLVLLNLPQQLSLLPSLLSSSLNILQIILVNTAVINESIVYAIVATKYIKFPITKVTTKNIANIIDATKNGHLRIFCSAIDTIITAIGKAKNNSNKFILFLPSLVPVVYYKIKIIIPIL